MSDETHPWIVRSGSSLPGQGVTARFSSAAAAFAFMRRRIDAEIARVVDAGGNPLENRPVAERSFDFSLTYDPVGDDA